MPDGNGRHGPRVGFSISADNAETRAAIDRILALVPEGLARRNEREALEIALAEVLNNIVEHAYDGSETGQIEILVEQAPPGLHFTIWDDGAAMPALRLPGGAPADDTRGGHEQAEGGYGLFMIRQLARKLRYEREGDRNKLSFRMPLTVE